MKMSIQIVWAGGSEAYHLQQAMKHFPEPYVLDALVQQLLRERIATHYADAMRRAVEIVEYHRHLQDGVTIARDAHRQLQGAHGAGGYPATTSPGVR